MLDAKRLGNGTHNLELIVRLPSIRRLCCSGTPHHRLTGGPLRYLTQYCNYVKFPPSKFDYIIIPAMRSAYLLMNAKNRSFSPSFVFFFVWPQVSSTDVQRTVLMMKEVLEEAGLRPLGVNRSPRAPVEVGLHPCAALPCLALPCLSFCFCCWLLFTPPLPLPFLPSLFACSIANGDP